MAPPQHFALGKGKGKVFGKGKNLSARKTSSIPTNQTSGQSHNRVTSSKSAPAVGGTTSHQKVLVSARKTVPRTQQAVRRFRPGQLALKEIKKLQKSTTLMMARLPF